MTYPNPGQYGPPPGPAAPWGPSWGSPPDPGPIRLRPQTVGELLGAGFGLVRRHLPLLGTLGVLIAAVSTGTRWAVLAASGTLETFAAGEWAADVLAGRATSLPSGIFAAAGASSLLTVTGAVTLAGVAVAAAAADAIGTGKDATAVRGRLSGRGGAILAVGLLVGVSTSLGLALLVLPGLLIYLVWGIAGPAVTMERGTVAAALHRSARLTRGHRGRLLGATVLMVVIVLAIETFAPSAAQSIAVQLAPEASAVTMLLIGDAAAVAASALTMSWVAAVIALFYIDVRIRTEHLGHSLRAFVAARHLPPQAGGAAG